MRRIACARFGKDSSGTGVPMLDSLSRMASCSGTAGSGTSGSATSGSLMGWVALQGMLDSEVSVSL